MLQQICLKSSNNYRLAILELFLATQAKNYPGKSHYIVGVTFFGAFLRQASEQYLIDSQFLAHDFRHVISRLQVLHSLLGRLCLLPLNVRFSVMVENSVLLGGRLDLLDHELYQPL